MNRDGEQIDVLDFDYDYEYQQQVHELGFIMTIKPVSIPLNIVTAHFLFWNDQCYYLHVL